MSTGKPSTNIPYNRLPSSPHQQQQPPQYYVILPYYSGHRPNHRRCLTYTTVILLIAAALFLLWPSDPHLQVVHLSLNKFSVHKSPKPSLDIELGVRIKIRNRDVYSLNYKSLNVSVEYRGEQLGFVTSDNGSVRAFGTSFIDATLVLDGAEVISEVVFLIADLVKGSIPFTTTSEIKGSLGVVLFNVPISAKLSCEVVMNAYNQTIERQDCYPA
nr:late embryogenesis abundant protein, LEA-14 [Tanacetum cinerariifolium]